MATSGLGAAVARCLIGGRSYPVAVSSANHRRPKRDARWARPQTETDTPPATDSAGSLRSPGPSGITDSTSAAAAPIAAQREVLMAEEAVHRLSTAEPLDVDGIRTVGIGVALWTVTGLVLLLVYRDDLEADGNQWWLWTCLAGVGIGLLGWAYCRRRRDRTRAVRDRH